MNSILSDYRSSIIVLLCFLGIGANAFACQYRLNPMGTIIVLPLALLILYFTFSPVLSLFGSKYRTRKTIGVICAVALAWTVSITASKFIPNGVAVRLSQFSEQDFQEVAGLIGAAYEKHRGDSGELFRGDDNYQNFLKELKESHDIFNLSDFPMSLHKEEDHVSIGWYGGMPGGYDVVIFDKANPPKRLREYNVAYLYDTVAYYEIEDYASDW
jgi:hypothetical protein